MLLLLNAITNCAFHLSSIYNHLRVCLVWKICSTIPHCHQTFSISKRTSNPTNNRTEPYHTLPHQPETPAPTWRLERAPQNAEEPQCPLASQQLEPIRGEVEGGAVPGGGRRTLWQVHEDIETWRKSYQDFLAGDVRRFVVGVLTCTHDWFLLFGDLFYMFS